MTFSEIELRRLVVRVKRFVLIKSYLGVFIGLLWQGLLIHGNFVEISRGRDPVVFFGAPVSNVHYAVVNLGVLSYLTGVALSALIKFRPLIRTFTVPMRTTNNLAGLTILILLVGTLDSSEPRIVNSNNAFYIALISIGCVKRGYDFNIKRLHRPTWTAGNIFS